MALPSSAPIKLSEIVTEFGGSVPHNLTEYVRGGVYVPDYPHNDAVPIAAPIGLNDFLGAVDPVIGISGFITLSDQSEVTSEVTLTVLRDGSKTGTDWCDPNHADIGLDFDIRLDQITGFTNTGLSTGVWYPLTSQRSWGLRVHSGSATFTGTLLLRAVGPGPSFGTTAISMSVESEA